MYIINYLLPVKIIKVQHKITAKWWCWRRYSEYDKQRERERRMSWRYDLLFKLTAYYIYIIHNIYIWSIVCSFLLCGCSSCCVSDIFCYALCVASLCCLFTKQHILILIIIHNLCIYTLYYIYLCIAM